MDESQTATLQAYLQRQGDNAAHELGKLLTGLGCDPAGLVKKIEAEQLAAEADALKQGLISLAARGFDLSAAAEVVARMAEEERQ